MKINLIGSSPSSGSTYIANLISSHEDMSVPPEYGIFSTNQFYSKNWKRDFFKQSRICFPISSHTHPYIKNLKYSGFTIEKINEIISNSKTQVEFMRNIAINFNQYNFIDNKKVFYEKTPDNIFNVDKFLNIFPESHFIIILRNPVDTIKSLINRGYSFYVSSLTWLMSVSLLIRFNKFNNLKIIKYEQVIKNPNKFINNFLIKFNEELNIKYDDNLYEKFLKNESFKHPPYIMKSWNVKKSKNNYFTHEEYNFLKKIKLNKKFSNFYLTNDLSFVQALKITNYEDTFNNMSIRNKFFYNKSKIIISRPYFNEIYSNIKKFLILNLKNIFQLKSLIFAFSKKYN